MIKNNNTYDSQIGLNASLTSILSIFDNLGVTRVFYKLLSPNDNSKNQIYLGGHLNQVNWLPSHNLTASTSNSLRNPKRRHKYTKFLDFKWIDCAGAVMPAPTAKLIYYPQYPEVRFSGFLRDSLVGMGGWMNESKKGRYQGRFLILGVDKAKVVYGYLAVPGSKIASQICTHPQIDTNGPSQELQLPTALQTPTLNARAHLLSELKRIHSKGFIAGKRLKTDLSVIPYKALNGGGYTLEAELGIVPNGSAKPDFRGWEVKQFGVKKWKPLYNSEKLTLLTPEPNAGEYQTRGFEYFLNTYGYLSQQGVPDRWNFGGIHRYRQLCAKSQLTLEIVGFDIATKQITNPNGYLTLNTVTGVEAASWTFPKLLEHWTTKHAKAVYIPSLKKKNNVSGIEYWYSNEIRLYEGTNFEMFLNAFINDFFFLDPASKIENISTTKTPKKKRNQFRIPWAHLDDLYLSRSDVKL